MQYYIVKSGMQMYDISRAYGLGYILNILSNCEAIVKDFGYCYSVEVNTKPNLSNVQKLSILIGGDLRWDRVFLTLKRAQREKKERELGDSLTDKHFIKGLLEMFQELTEPRFLSSKSSSGETLLQSLEIGATKGLRELIRLRSYTEGTQVYIPKEDFVLSAIGHLHFTIWRWSDDKAISILLSPGIEGVNIGGIGNLKDLKDKVEGAVGNHSAGVSVTLSNVAINLAKNIYEMKMGEQIFIPNFSSLVYGVMVGAGQQMKPYGGGIYPLDFPYKLIDSSIAGEIFDKWIEVFNKTNRRAGYEDLAISLSEFITCPSFDTFERYLKIHLRHFLTKDIKPSIYEEKILEEIMQYV
ncbi:MAG: hypothetical protein QMC80_03535 [Thermoplasmatales archaeon]|nr:hypothetical protein [Thermoplasmatales archaeon]